MWAGIRSTRARTRGVAALGAAALLLSACGDDDPTMDESAEPAAEADAADADEPEDADDGQAAAGGICDLVDPDGLEVYVYDIAEGPQTVEGEVEGFDGHPGCEYRGDPMGRWTLTVIADLDDERIGDATGEDALTAFAQARMEEESRFTFFDSASDFPLEANEHVDAVGYTDELYVLSGDHLLLLQGDPFMGLGTEGGSASGQLIVDGHFPTMDPDEVL